MYKSVSKWANLKVYHHAFLSCDGSGDRVYSDGTLMLASIEGSVREVQNREGREVVSSRQLYIEGKYTINEGDKYAFDGEEHLVIATAPFYLDGKKDLWVVYL